MFVPRTISVQSKKAGKRTVKPSVKNVDSALISSNALTQSYGGKLEEGQPSAFSKDFSASIELNANAQNHKTDEEHGIQLGKIDVEKYSQSSDEDEPIVDWSMNQRWPDSGEPVCAMCGRYGAYICDKTESDVCSIECKKRNLERSIKERISKRILPDGSLVPHRSTPAPENCQLKYEAQSSEKCLEENDHQEIDPQSFALYFDENYKYKARWNFQNLTDDNITFLREKLDIKVKGEKLIPPGLEFSHFLFPSKLADNLAKSSYLSPTPVQMQAIPVGLSKRDLLACAQTSTGKSASFLLPIITRVFSTTELLPQKHKCCFVPLALILCPTRELCMQIEDQAKAFCKGLRNMKTVLLIGGNPLPQQLHRLEQGIQIMIATPGRLNEILEKHSDQCDLRFVQMFVLDEVDVMLKLGFQAQVDQIIQKVPQSAQKMMFSATIPPSIEKIASNILYDPVFVSVGPPGIPNKAVKQIVLWVEENSKKKRLFDLVNDRKHFKPPIVVFVDSKLGADMLADALYKVCGVSSASLHGDKTQSARTQILQDFQNGSYQTLVCTPVLGRGIDLLNVVMVVNFDMPPTVNEYVHQVGRAGKLEKTGYAISFINNTNKETFLSLFELSKDSNIKLPLELVNSPYLQQQQDKRGRKRRERRNDEVTSGNLMALLKEHTGKRKR